MPDGEQLPLELARRPAYLAIFGQHSRTALALPETLAFDDWLACGRTLGEIEGAVQWWIGDWWAFGDRAYGKRKAIVESDDWTGPAFQTCADCAFVSRKFESSRRREVLPFAHHREVAALPPAEQEAWLNRAQEKDWSRNQLRAAIKQGLAFQRTKDSEFRAEQLGKFVVIYADPPWRYENPPIGASNRAIENHYPTMELDQICALPIGDIAHDNSILFLWATAPKLYECMRVIDAWGFVYRTDMVWVKDKIGMGYHVRNRHESLLIAKKGELPPPAVENRPDSVIEAPRLDHSAKPLRAYELIDQMYPSVRKVELFQRAPRDGWTGWGNQV